MATPEGAVKRKVKALLKDYKVYQFWPVQTGYGAPTLDCLGGHRGVAFAIETKAPGKKLTKRQLKTRDEMEAAGYTVFVIDNTDDVTLKDLKSFLEIPHDYLPVRFTGT